MDECCPVSIPMIESFRNALKISADADLAGVPLKDKMMGLLLKFVLRTGLGVFPVAWILARVQNDTVSY